MTAHGQTKFTTLHCSVCGAVMGKKPGVQVITGLVCADPLCNFQGPVSPNQQRDALIVNAALEGVPVSQIAFSADMSRQRVYQILDTWKQGV